MSTTDKGKTSKIQPLEIDNGVADEFVDSPPVAALEESDLTLQQEPDSISDDNTSLNTSVPIDRHAVYAFLYAIYMAASSLTSLIPFLLMIHVIFNLTSRWYFCIVTATLQFVEKLIVLLVLRRILYLRPTSRAKYGAISESQSEQLYFNLPIFHSAVTGTEDENNSTDVSPRFSICRVLIFLCELCIVVFISVCYLNYVPYMCKEIFINLLFIEADGVVAHEWTHESNQFYWIVYFSRFCGVLYLLGGIFALMALFHAGFEYYAGDGTGVGQTSFNSTLARIQRFVEFQGRVEISNFVWKLSFASSILTGVFLFLSLASAWNYLVDHPLPSDNNLGPHCDPIDTTECMLPFPSNFFAIEDEASKTGLRLDIESKSLCYRDVTGFYVGLFGIIVEFDRFIGVIFVILTYDFCF